MWGPLIYSQWFEVGKRLGREAVFRTEPLTCGIWYYPQVDSVKIELNCRPLRWCQRMAWRCRKSHPHTHIRVGASILPSSVLHTAAIVTMARLRSNSPLTPTWLALKSQVSAVVIRWASPDLTCPTILYDSPLWVPSRWPFNVSRLLPWAFGLAVPPSLTLPQIFAPSLLGPVQVLFSQWCLPSWLPCLKVQHLPHTQSPCPFPGLLFSTVLIHLTY